MRSEAEDCLYLSVCWRAFARTGAPRVAGQPIWPEYSSGRMLSLRPGSATRAITDAQYAAEHQCAFWDGS